MKKFVGKSIACVLALTSAFGLAACGDNGAKGTVDDAKTINVRLCKAGYGVEWVYEVADKFTKAYASEGYKVNILTPSRDMQGEVVITELLQGYEKTKVDLYITGAVPSEKLGAQGEYGVLAEDIGELVLNQKAIGYDGQEESETVLEKMVEGWREEIKCDYTGVYYTMPNINTTSGLVVNTKKLSAYGLSLPRTTNELLDCVRKIYLGHNGVANSEESGVFPITYVPGANNGYNTCWTTVMAAQYDLEEFNQLMSMEIDGQAMTENGYEVFNYQGIEEMLTVSYELFDANIASYGTTTQSLDQAQAAIMRDGGAVFMANGDWMLNEVKLNFAKNLNDIEFINFPVVSAVGTKVFGAGTSYNFDDAKCEDLLCYIIDLVDANKSVEEIVAAVQSEKGVTITAADAQEIATARGIYLNRGTERQMLINKGSAKKEIAALFLRMIASEDAAQTMKEKANATSGYSTVADTQSQYKYIRQASAVLTNVHSSSVVSTSFGYRKKLQAGTGRMATVSHEPVIITNKNFSIYDGEGHIAAGRNYAEYRTQAQLMQQEDYQTAQTRWSEWKKNDK